MIVAIPTETNDTRVAVIPATVKELVKLGFTVNVQAGAGQNSFISDQEFTAAGANIINDVNQLYSNADMVLKVSQPSIAEADLLKDGSIFVSLIQATREPELVKKFVAKKISAFSMHLVPRTTLAQKMDALSSQANIAGYKAVLIGACHLPKYMPLLMTAAGTMPPAKTLVLGAGVAGLQAIATAKRLGSQVEAFDVRPEVKEQVESLGAKFVEVPADENDGVGDGGYAKETSDAYKQRQAALLKERIAKTDLVITTALIPGRPAPLLIPDDMVQAMSAGSVIMDLAAENGGNCAATEAGKVVTKHGIIIDGSLNLPGTMPLHASQLYAKNIIAFISYFCPEGKPNFNMEDEIIAGAIFTHNGEITDEQTKAAIAG